MMNAARRGKSSGDRTRRQFRGRQPKNTWLIVCEGRETEPNYLNGLKQSDSVSSLIAMKVIPGKGGSRTQIVNYAVKKKRSHPGSLDKVICVLDTESLQSEDTRDDLAQARRKAKENGVFLYLSNPAFEVWLLAHFTRTSKSFSDCDAVIVELDKKWTAEFRQPYDKSDRDVYAKLALRTPVAIKNARDVAETDHEDKNDIIQCNSSTEVYKLVDDLLSGKTD